MVEEDMEGEDVEGEDVEGEGGLVMADVCSNNVAK